MYRPLIRLSKNTEQNTFFPFDYVYSLQDISAIKKYLPKVLTLAGVDASRKEQVDEEEVKREGLKLKAVAGVSVVTEEPIKFYGKNDLLIERMDCCMCIDLPFNSKQNP